MAEEKTRWYWEDEGINKNKTIEKPFNAFEVPTFTLTGTKTIVAEMKETQKELLFTVRLLGFRKEDISVAVSENRLELSAENSQNKERKQEQFFQRSSASIHFHRSLSLPSLIEPSKTKAKFDKDILQIIMPKKEVKKKKDVRIS